MSDSYSFRSTSSDQPAEVDIWDVIAQKVDLLVEAWDQFAETGRSPDLASLMEDVHTSQRRSVLTELIKIDLEYRWQQVQQPERLEFYIAKFAEFAGGRDLPVDLIYEEIQIRLQVGDQIEFAELRQRFPKQAEALQFLVGSIQVPPNDAGADSSDCSSKIVVQGNGSAAKYSHTAADDTLPLATGTGKRTLHELVPGDSLEDFDLLLELGAGSFAKVFLARQRSLERLVALKISKDSGSEPRTLAQMDHPNIVRVFDQRVCAQPPVRLLYMELVPGGTLHDVVRRLGEVEAAERTGRLMLDVVDLNLASSGIAPPEGSDIRRRLARTNWYEAVCEIGLRLAQGLAYAHEKGVLHRDIKPANVLLTPECSPKLADFNISFQDGREDEQAEDAFGGSIAYMSPEQLEACHPALGGSPHKVREASDIYSVGVMLWELTSGKRPFADPPPDQRWSLMLQRMIDQRRAGDFDQLEATLPHDCPLSLRTVLKKCLQSAENLRYRSAQQLANALKLCLHPRLWNLLREPTSGIGRLPLRFPVFTVLMLTLVPSILAAVFNFFYNQHAIIEKLGNAKSLFMNIQAAINAVAFPVGMAIVVWCAIQTKRQMRSTPGANSSLWCALFLGQQMARIALALWVLSGFAYPIAIHWGLQDGVGIGMYVHFALSLALCGMLAGTYPFFFVTALGIRWFVPEMIRCDVSPGPVKSQLEKLRILNRMYLLLTASVPLLGILLMVMFGFRGGEQDLSIYLVIASVTGLIGFGAMFGLHRMIEEDLAALEILAVEE